jgi:hypothetical protein
MSRAPPCEGRAKAGIGGHEIPARLPFCGSACLPGVSARIRAGGPVVDPRRGAPTPAAAPRWARTGTTRAERRHARRRRLGPPPDVLCIIRGLRRLAERSSFELFPGFRWMRDGMVAVCKAPPAKRAQRVAHRRPVEPEHFGELGRSAAAREPDRAGTVSPRRSAASRASAVSLTAWKRP